MVDLDSVETTKPPPAAITEQLPSNAARKLCRLCLHENAATDKAVDIFDETGLDDKGNKLKAIEELLYELFQIKVRLLFAV